MGPMTKQEYKEVLRGVSNSLKTINSEVASKMNEEIQVTDTYDTYTGNPRQLVSTPVLFLNLILDALALINTGSISPISVLATFASAGFVVGNGLDDSKELILFTLRKLMKGSPTVKDNDIDSSLSKILEKTSKEIDKIEMAMEFFNSLTPEEEGKYLSINKGLVKKALK